ncbi:MAG: serine/threonine-protein kinase, partial [Candidatus Krumholzibacteria bacterium]|nr:serine/threonine-protein kinase [Candidatus Krumholzibacteria bacterium]
MIGKTFAHYEITEQIGVGGMGAVYRARDTRLDRDVAIKVIPPAMSNDPERVARFQREAKTLASMQHPNIAAIHGFENVDGVRFLVMELVEGADLAAQLKNGPLPEHEAVEIIRHVAAGLNAAHRNGIVHRDLKPANIMLTPDGTVKILDFGLARATSPDVDQTSDPGLSPTLTAAMTQAGTILGTAAYMAPEQARGKSVDHRADIWAMGTILFELLTAQRLFVGETVTDVLASVIKIAPDLDELPADTSRSVRRMLERCLQRDPRRRLDSAADAILELDEDEVEVTAATVNSRRSFLPWIPAVLLGLAAVMLWFRSTPEPEPG